MEQKTGKERKQAIAEIVDEKRFSELAEENPDAPVLFIGNHPYIIDYKLAKDNDDCFEDYAEFLQFRLKQLKNDMNKLIKELNFCSNDDFIEFMLATGKTEDWEEICDEVYEMESLGEYVA